MFGLRTVLARTFILVSVSFVAVAAFSANTAPTFPRVGDSRSTFRSASASHNSEPNHKMVSQTLLKLLWNTLTAVGMRRLGRILKQTVPAYKNTTFCFCGENVEGCIALTIDDGLSRGGPESSLLPQVLQLLQAHNAHATFFVCTAYTTREAAADLVAHGHELGNHLGQDLSGHYAKLSKEDFEAALKRANDFLDEIDGGVSGGRWFRAPQGIMTRIMRDVVEAQGLRHALGDAYCDDWAFANSSTDIRHVAPLMLRQVHTGGSIAIFHMPERGFRESSLEALEEFLEGAKAKGLRCMTLSEISRLEQSA